MTETRCLDTGCVALTRCSLYYNSLQSVTTKKSLNFDISDANTNPRRLILTFNFKIATCTLLKDLHCFFTVCLEKQQENILNILCFKYCY